jgi:hypothetical protein
MTPAELEHSRRSMQNWWYELVQAEARGASLQDLERVYGLYLRAVETYNHCAEACLLDHQETDATEMESSQASCLPET